MSLFKSPREKRLWRWVLLVLIAIYASLGLAGTLAGYLRDRGLIVAGFWLGLILVAATVVIYGLKTRPGKAEIVVWIGIAAVYLMVLLRTAIPEERSHLIEYSVLAIFIHQALRERALHDANVRAPALIALLATTVFGVIDEGIQKLLPFRVFDTMDILFNSLAALMAIGSSVLLSWVRKLFRKK